MIARVWHGTTKPADADGFLNYIRQTGEKAYRETEGNIAVLILRRVENDRADFLLISLWNSLDAVKNFAGADYEKAVYLFPEDEKFLIEFEPNVAHYEAILNPDLREWCNLK
jgi:heme-degrading monooxygenase HmoA